MHRAMSICENRNTLNGTAFFYRHLSKAHTHTHEKKSEKTNENLVALLHMMMLSAAVLHTHTRLAPTSAERSYFWFQPFVSFVSSTGKFMCLHFIRAHFLLSHSVRSFGRVFGVCHWGKILYYFSLSFSRFRFTWFSHIDTLTHIFWSFLCTYICSQTYYVQSNIHAGFAGCAPKMGKVLLCIFGTASFQNRFRYCFLPTSFVHMYRRIRSNGSIFFFSLQFFDTFRLNWTNHVPVARHTPIHNSIDGVLLNSVVASQ